MKRLAQLKTARYRIALSTTSVCADPFFRLLESVHFVKLDIMACDEGMIERSVAVHPASRPCLLSDKVKSSRFSKHVEWRAEDNVM